MFTNRFFTILFIVALAAVIGLTVREAVGSELTGAERIQQNSSADMARWEAMGEYYANQARAQRMDSATRSYIAWGEALQAAGKLGDAGTCSNQENIFDGIDSGLDSATRSYIAWGLALQAKDDLCR